MRRVDLRAAASGLFAALASLLIVPAVATATCGAACTPTADRVCGACLPGVSFNPGSSLTCSAW